MFRNRHDPAFPTMDDGDGATPIALARDAPVAQAIINDAFAASTFLQAADDLGLSGLDGQAIEKVRVYEHTAACIGFIGDVPLGRISASGCDHRPHGKAVFAGEIEVALVVGGTAENGPAAIVHKHEIGYIHRQFTAFGKRVANGQTGIVAFFTAVSISASEVPM